MLKNHVTLKNAGYREKVFTKSLLAQKGMIKEFEKVLNTDYFDTHTDHIHIRLSFPAKDISRDYKVSREGTESKEILESLGFDDRDCLGE